MSSRLRALLLALVALFAAVVLLPVVGAAPAQAAPWCDDEVPLPATPLTGGGFTTTPANTSDEDPFADPSVPIQSVYGWHYKMVSYDTGCTPGSSLMPRMGTELANGLSEPVGMMASVGHGLMSAVISPTWLEPIDAGVEEGVRQVRFGTWFPYVGLVVLLVGVGMLWSTRKGKLDSTTTAGVWALIVLGLATYLGSYPLHATQMVDGAVQEAALGIATAMSEDPDFVGPPTPVDGPQEAIDKQWNSIVRSTTYRTWAEGMFGSATSQTALTHGPELFKASHLTWTEAATLESDPSGAGQDILDDKEETFQDVAEEIESADPYAYSHVQGKHWGSRLSTAGTGLVAGVLTMLFLVVAPIGMFVGYVVIRVAVMFSPAAGLLFMVEKLRNVALGLLSKVGRFVVMGPLWLLGALVVLRLNSAVLNAAGIAFWLQLLLCLVVSYVAWVLLKPVSGIPGLRGAHRILRTAAITAAGWRVGNAAGRVGRHRGGQAEEDESDQDEQSSEKGQVVYTAPSQPALGPARPREEERPAAGSGERVDWGHMTAQRATPGEDLEGGAAGERPRAALMGRPVAMSSRRVRHLSSSSSAPGALTVVGTQPAAVDESAAGQRPEAAAGSAQKEGADADQSAVFDQGATVVPFALPLGASDRQEAAQEETEEARAPTVVVSETFAPRRDPLLPEEDSSRGGVPAIVAGPTGEPVDAEEPVAEDGQKERASAAAAGAVETSLPDRSRGGVAGEREAGTEQATTAGAAEVVMTPEHPHVVQSPAAVAEAPAPAGSDSEGDIPLPAEEPRTTFMPDEAIRTSSQGAQEVETAAEQHPAEGVPRRVRDGAVMDEDDLPTSVHEANVTLGSDGKPVFQVYRPSGRSVVRRVD